MRIVGSLWIVMAQVALVACSSGGGRRGGSDPATPQRDGGTANPTADGGDLGSLPPANPCAPGCGPEELCGDLGDGNGLDDDCDGTVDEGCSCTYGTTRPCFAGPPDRRDVGACTDGLMTCDEFLHWGPCVGGVSPATEACDGTDNDCNAITDDVEDCNAPVTCPGNDHSPPLSTYRIRGDRVYGGAAQGWTWSIGCPDSVPADLCPAPANPSAEDTEVYFTASGAYRVSVSLVLEDGSPFDCSWTVYVAGSGLRVELNWDTMLDTQGGSDVDLHLHRWTRNGTDTGWFTGEDCYYGNCTPRAGTGLFEEIIEWSDHPDSPLENCQDAPHGGGARWQAQGSCRNPRLDVDTNGIDGPCSAVVTDPNEPAFCAPENINVDSPIPGMPYRIMVNYYSDFRGAGRTRPRVNIYCGGELRSTVGTDPPISLVAESAYAGPFNESWLVADVVFVDGVCGSQCRVYAIDQIAELPEPDDFVLDEPELPFGPPWSCSYDAARSTCE